MSSDGQREPRRAVDLGNLNGATASWRPFNCDFIAADATDIQIALQRVGVDQFSGPLAHLTERLEQALRVDAEFLGELPAGCSLRVFAVAQLALRN